ncbi:MAG: HD domain-containing protein [Anaerosomatales bacterium]|nr:HD domain-containing protein [Anaerosomatales bacterium]
MTPTRTRLFGKHLHNQIVVPLLVAAMIVGVVATLVAVGLISRVVNEWIDQNASATNASVVARIDYEAAEMAKVAKVAAENPQLVDTVRTGDVNAIAAHLVLVNQALRADNLALIDRNGRVVASTGDLELASGLQPLGPGERDWILLSMSHPIFVDITTQPTLTAMEPVKGGQDGDFTLLVSTVIDEEFIGSITEGIDAAVCLYDRSFVPMAARAPMALGGEELAAALLDRTGDVGELLETADTSSDPRPLAVAGQAYRAVSQAMTFENDPTNSTVYVVTVMGTQVAEDTRRTTTNLIMLWSVVGVAALVALNWWVARRVSDPLASLSESVGKVAEGDFSAKVSIEGDNEVSQLADNFNRMTDSLRDRSESLTKKVLELATLYEMSRALGSMLDLDVLLDSVLDSALRIFNVELGYVTLRDKETAELEVRAWRGAAGGRPDETAVRSSMSEWVIREGRPLIFNPSREAEGRIDTVSGALAALCVPLVSADGTIGAITVGSRNMEHRFTSDDVRLLATIANHVTIAIGNIELFSSLQDAYLATVRALAAAVDAKDPFTRGHSDRVARFGLVIADALELSSEQRIALEMAAYLHDIGKIGISEEILLKPGKLSDDEMGQMRHHPLIGANILRPVAFPWPIAPIVRHHHEHYDGRGYPAGLKGEEIPMLARVLTVADAYEAMIADRPYRRGRSEQDAIMELRRCAGTHFDPKIVDAFIAVLEREAQLDEAAASAWDELGPDESRAVVVAVCDGMVASFRRLGGPRLAANLETDINVSFEAEGLPYLLSSGHLTVSPDVSDDGDHHAVMRRAVRIVAEAMERTSGESLVDHFYTEAVETLPERMRLVAERLRLHADE